MSEEDNLETPAGIAKRLKAEALRLGFADCRIASATPLPETRKVFEQRIGAGFYDGLPWLSVDRARRCTEPELVLEGARSVVVLAAPYASGASSFVPDDELRGKVARYAWGRDYHRVLEKQLRRLCAFLEEVNPGARCRPLVDYGPLAERAYAERAGLGWFGKNTNLLLPRVGSWVLLAEILTTAKLEADEPLRKSCGSCHRCVAACPTSALSAEGYLLDNQRCISFQTIENRGPIPRDLRPLIGDWLFGCDICQEVCPVGRQADTASFPDLDATSQDDKAPALIPLLALDEAAFREQFAGRAIMRAKRDGLVRNACIVLGNLGDRNAVPALARALLDPSALVRGHAAWALGRLAGPSAAEALQAALDVEREPWVREEIELALKEAREEKTRGAPY